MNKLSFRSSHWIAVWLPAVVMLTLPFIRIHGESALRFDVPSLKLYLFGTVIWISDVYFFLLGFLLFLSGVMLFTVLYGRAWCGWACPQTVISHFSRRINQLSVWFSSRKFSKFATSQTLHIILSMVVATNLMFYFVPPRDMAADLLTFNLGPWTFLSWAFITVLIYLNISFVRQRFCATICPYPRVAGIVSDDSPLTVAFDNKRADGSAMPSRRVLGISTAFAFIAVLFAYHLYVRIPLDFWVFRDDPQPYKQAGKEDDTINAYSLILENRSLDPEVFRLKIAGIKDAQLIMNQNPFVLQPNSATKMKVYVRAFKKNLTYRDTQLRFILENVVSQEIRIEQEAVFIYPVLTERGLEI
jgi:FixG-like putative oxidoreductase/4Fe-4S binding protein